MHNHTVINELKIIMIMSQFIKIEKSIKLILLAVCQLKDYNR